MTGSHRNTTTFTRADTATQSAFDRFYLQRTVMPTIPYLLVAGGIVTLIELVLQGFGPAVGNREWLPLLMIPMLGACYVIARSSAHHVRPMAAATACMASLASVAVMAELAAHLFARGPATGLYAALLLAVLCAALAGRWWHLVIICILFVGPLLALELLDGPAFRQPVLQVGTFTTMLVLSTTITYVIGMRVKWSYFRLLDDAQLRVRRDALTGVLNHLGWQEMIADTGDSDPTGVVIFFDVDNFREVNNLAGHRVGDQLLVYLAITLQATMGRHATVARLGGDEFAVFLPSPEADSVATRLADLQHRIERDTTWSGITMTHGVGFCNAGQSITEGWIDADLNLNRAKQHRPSIRPLTWPTIVSSQNRAVG